MFGFFKKRDARPEPVPDGLTNQRFQTLFATKWAQSALAYSVAGFSGAALCGEGTKATANAWRKMWASNFPKAPVLQPDGLTVNHFHTNGYLIVFITFPPPLT